MEVWGSIPGDSSFSVRKSIISLFKMLIYLKMSPSFVVKAFAHVEWA